MSLILLIFLLLLMYIKAYIPFAPFGITQIKPKNQNLITTSPKRLPATSEITSANTNTGKDYSFIRDELRAYAMNLHTKDQAPIEGKQPAKKPVSSWEPQLSDYVQFLRDSLEVYKTMEEIVNSYDELKDYRNTGLERTEALKADIDYICNTFNTNVNEPECGEAGKAYSKFLKSIVKESIPKFMCHYYNHYFAHTAGGLMIGRKMSALLLNKETLKFYQWDGNVKEHLENTKCMIDNMASTWSSSERDDCIKETASCFHFGGSLNAYLRDPFTR